jgi:hypothetical protein
MAIGRPKVDKKKIDLSITVNTELNELLEKVVTEKKVSKSQYIEYFIKKDIENKEKS